MKSPFCKVCYDTGKPESLYTSHYVNDVPGKKGIVVCPTLLALECRYCKKTGHTVSRCPMISDSQKFHVLRKRNEKKYPTVKEQEKEKSDNLILPNRFSALENDLPEENNVSTTTYASVLSQKETLIIKPLCIFIPRSPSTSPPPEIRRTLRWAEYDSD